LEAELARPLLEVLRDVSLDPSERAAFSADPEQYLAEHGYDDVPPEDLGEAFGLMHDTLPAETAQALVEDPVYDVPTTGGEALDVESAAEVGDMAPFGDVNGDFDAATLRGTDDDSLDDDSLDGSDVGDADADTDADVELGQGYSGADMSDDSVGDDDDGGLYLDGGDAVAFGVGSGSDVEGDEPLGLEDDTALSGLDDGGDDVFDADPFGSEPFAEIDDLGADLDTGAFGHGDLTDDGLDVDGPTDEPDDIDDIGSF
jgi:hypothetical protein